MRNWLLGIVVAILIISLSINGFLLVQIGTQVSSSQQQVSGITSDVSSIKNDVVSLKNQVASRSTPTAVVPLQPQAAEAINLAEPTVVRIDVTGSGFQAAGSGFFIDPAGYIITNQHVIDKATAIRVTTMPGNKYDATVVQSDAARDLAVLKIIGNTAFPVLGLGSSGDLTIGTDVLAIGFPFGSDIPGPATVTHGIISARRVYNNKNFIQTDTPINPGNSGGCLITLDGKVIAVNAETLFNRVTDPENISLSIPIDEVKLIIQKALGK